MSGSEPLRLAEEAYRLAFRILAEDDDFRARYLDSVDEMRAELLKRLLGYAEIEAQPFDDPGNDMAARALVALTTLPKRQLLALWLRLAGAQWKTVGRLLGCTRRHAIRLRKRALEAVALPEAEEAKVP